MQTDKANVCKVLAVSAFSLQEGVGSVAAVDAGVFLVEAREYELNVLHRDVRWETIHQYILPSIAA